LSCDKLSGSVFFLLFILTANGFLPGGNDITIRHNTLKQNTAHKTTQTIKDTLHTMNAMQIQLQLQIQKMQLQLQLNKLILIKKA
jgi:hypothetical protein